MQWPQFNNSVSVITDVVTIKLNDKKKTRVMVNVRHLNLGTSQKWVETEVRGKDMQTADSSYFSRRFMMKEGEWSLQHGVVRIWGRGEFFSQRKNRTQLCMLRRSSETRGKVLNVGMVSDSFSTIGRNWIQKTCGK